MGQASNTIYGDIVSATTMNALKEQLQHRSYAMTYLWNVSKFAKKGVNTIHIPFLGSEKAQTVAIGEAFNAPGKNTAGAYSLTINKKAGAPFDVSLDLQEQTYVNFLKEQSRNSSISMLESMDVEILSGLIKSIPTEAKKDFADSTTNVDTISETDFIEARKYLNEKGCPNDKRFCFISPTHEAQIFKISNFISADKISQKTKMPIPEGVIGRLLGFDIVVLPYIPKVDKAGNINATTAKNDSFPIIFGHKYSYAWAKQYVGTLSEQRPLETADRYVPQQTYGDTSIEKSYIFQISDKKTVDPA